MSQLSTSFFFLSAIIVISGLFILYQIFRERRDLETVRSTCAPSPKKRKVKRSAWPLTTPLPSNRPKRRYRPSADVEDAIVLSETYRATTSGKRA
jgi:hypothetical protein